MKTSGPMIVEFKHGNYLVELKGSLAKVWVGYGLPEYDSDIDGIEQWCPELWQAMIDNKVIKLK